MLPEDVSGAQADHKTPAEPEGGHRPVSFMQINQELMQTSTVHNVGEVTISDKRQTCHRTDLTWENQKGHS